MTSSDPPTSARNILMLANGNATQTTGQLFMALQHRLEQAGHSVDLRLRTMPRGIFPKLRAMLSLELDNLRRLKKADVLIVHSALSLALCTIVAARLLRRPVAAFVWDFYPESTRRAGNITNPVLLRLYAITEYVGLSASTNILLSSADYKRLLRPNLRSKATIVPLWPVTEVRAVPPPNDDPILNVAFAGQINSLRGLGPGISRLAESWGGPMTLHIYSRDSLPDSMRNQQASAGYTVVEHGFVSLTELTEALAKQDFGWVCLDESFDLPAFPSKSMTYLCAGIPILYTGPAMPAFEGWLSDHCLGVTLPQNRTIDRDTLLRIRDTFSDSRARYLEAAEESWSTLAGLL